MISFVLASKASFSFGFSVPAAKPVTWMIQVQNTAIKLREHLKIAFISHINYGTGAACRSVASAELSQYEFPPADAKLLEMLQNTLALWQE